MFILFFTQSSCQSGSNATATENNVNKKNTQNPMKLEAIKVANSNQVAAAILIPEDFNGSSQMNLYRNFWGAWGFRYDLSYQNQSGALIESHSSIIFQNEDNFSQFGVKNNAYRPILY